MDGTSSLEGPEGPNHWCSDPTPTPVDRVIPAASTGSCPRHPPIPERPRSEAPRTSSPLVSFWTRTSQDRGTREAERRIPCWCGEDVGLEKNLWFLRLVLRIKGVLETKGYPSLLPDVNDRQNLRTGLQTHRHLRPGPYPPWHNPPRSNDHSSLTRGVSGDLSPGSRGSGKNRISSRDLLWDTGDSRGPDSDRDGVQSSEFSEGRKNGLL